MSELTMIDFWLIDPLEAITLLVDGQGVPNCTWNGYSLGDQMMAEMDLQVMSGIDWLRPGFLFHFQANTQELIVPRRRGSYCL